MRDCPGTLIPCNCSGVWGPSSVIRVRSTVTASGLGFCTSTQVSKSPAVAPSARYQVLGDSIRGGVPRHISQPSSVFNVPAYIRPSCGHNDEMVRFFALPKPSSAPAYHSLPLYAHREPEAVSSSRFCPSNRVTPTSNTSSSERVRGAMHRATRLLPSPKPSAINSINWEPS